MLKDMKSDPKREKTDVIEEAIRPYAIAEKLRSLRQRKSMGLAQLAEHTGLSAAMLSKLENARLVPIFRPWFELPPCSMSDWITSSPIRASGTWWPSREKMNG